MFCNLTTAPPLPPPPPPPSLPLVGLPTYNGTLLLLRYGVRTMFVSTSTPFPPLSLYLPFLLSLPLLIVPKDIRLYVFFLYIYILSSTNVLGTLQVYE